MVDSLPFDTHRITGVRKQEYARAFLSQQTFFSVVSQEPTQAVSRVNHLLAFTQNIRRGWKCSSATINDLFFTVSLQKTFYNQS
jgi:hypothetical protein